MVLLLVILVVAYCISTSCQKRLWCLTSTDDNSLDTVHAILEAEGYLPIWVFQISLSEGYVPRLDIHEKFRFNGAIIWMQDARLNRTSASVQVDVKILDYYDCKLK